MIYKVRDAELLTVHELWPHSYSPDDTRQCMVCVSDGPCDVRDIPDGHPIRTSLVDSVSVDGKTVRTMNSTYEVSSWKS